MNWDCRLRVRPGTAYRVERRVAISSLNECASVLRLYAHRRWHVELNAPPPETLDEVNREDLAVQ